MFVRNSNLSVFQGCLYYYETEQTEILEAWCQNRVLSEFMLLSRIEYVLNELIWVWICTSVH
jgi:hypothetical protein